KSHSFGGEYLELVPQERIRYTDKFDDPNLPREIQTTVTLKKGSCGTELNLVQEGVPDIIPTDACYVG
ncbi:MAG TPA: SRPBCC domain-containing protein, partial [Pyrinomonadaceae bacterium]